MAKSDSDVPDDFDMGADGEEETKDRRKKNKFLEMLRAGNCQNAEWQRVKGLKVGSLGAQRTIVNAAIDSAADGRLCLDVKKRMFADLKDFSNKYMSCPKPTLLASSAWQRGFSVIVKVSNMNLL